jgi:predicted MFS family arabinose efflux permease
LQGLLVAILPLGGLLGSLISKKSITAVTRRNGMHLVLPVLAFAILLVQITTSTMLFIGRFLEGVCIGYYVSLAPIYLKEITPKSMKHITGSFFSLGKIIGVLLVIII